MYCGSCISCGEQVGSEVSVGILDGFLSYCEVLEFGICRVWVVHLKGGYAEFSVEISFKMGPAGPPRIPGWSPGRVLSTWYQSIRFIDSVNFV